MGCEGRGARRCGWRVSPLTGVLSPLSVLSPVQERPPAQSGNGLGRWACAQRALQAGNRQSHRTPLLCWWAAANEMYTRVPVDRSLRYRRMLVEQVAPVRTGK